MLARPIVSSPISFSCLYPLVLLTTKIQLSQPLLKRFQSTKSNGLAYLPHAFNKTEAARRFANHDSHRLFAPSDKTTQITIASNNPLKKVLLPFFGVNTSIARTKYLALYGIDYTYTTHDAKGNAYVRTETNWYPISGTLGKQNYSQEDADMRIYAGFTWYAPTIEKAMERYPVTRYLQPFTIENVAADTLVDSFLKRSAIAQESANQRINNAEEYRIQNDIEQRVSCDHVSIQTYSITYNSFNLSNFLLPAYILQYPNQAPRILPAISEKDTTIHGAEPLSVSKVTAASMATTSLLALLFPSVALPVRIGAVVTSTFVSALWARYNLSTVYLFHQRKLRSELDANETVAETIADKMRFDATSRNFIDMEKPFVLDVDPAFYKVMGLNPDKPFTAEDVQAAFSKKIKQAHPDKGGDAETTRKILEARNTFFNALAKKPDPNKKHFSTFVRTKVKEPPRSIPDPNTSTLIRAVLDEKNYEKAKNLVMNGNVHPDGHDPGENTLLTEATKRGDAKAVAFILNELKASPDTSCDCPHHNTALHYAAKSGQENIITILLQHGANPNLINSIGETPRDIAHKRSHKNAENLLAAKGGLLHSEGVDKLWVKFRSQFFRYSAKERTLLLDKNKLEYIPPGTTTTSSRKNIK